MCWGSVPSCHQGLLAQPGAHYSSRIREEALTLPHLLSLIVKFKVNLKKLAMVQLVENQNAQLRCDGP